VGYYSGSDGFLEVDGTNAATVTTWSFTASQETLDVTTLGDRDRKLIGGIRSISGSASISWYSASGDTSTQTQATTLLNKIVKADGTASSTATSAVDYNTSLALGITNSAGTAESITMGVIITSIAMTSSQGEILSAEISFEATDHPSAITF
jgi:hypothetical protein